MQNDTLESRRKVIVPLLRDCDRPVECSNLMNDAALLIQDYEKAYRISMTNSTVLYDVLEKLLDDYSSNGLQGKAGLYACKAMAIVKGEL